MSSQQVNGVTPHSQTLSHLTGYPLVADVLKVYQKNSLGAKSIELYNNLYKTIVPPVLPYLNGPYSFVEPYVKKADELGNSTLEWTDARFPVVQQTNLGNLREKVVDGVFLPLTLANQTKDYVFTTYKDESTKVKGEPGLIHAGKTLLSTELRIAFESYYKVIEFLGPRGKEFDEKARDLLSNGTTRAEELRDNAIKTASDYKTYAHSKFDEYSKVGQKKTTETKQTVEKKANEVTN